jgi:hypothetical protein
MKPLLSKSDRGNGNLTQNELIKLIHEIGKAIGMPSWEIQEFIQICTKLRTLKVGKDILQDYQKLQQDIVKLNEKRRSYVMKIFQLLNKDIENSLPDIILEELLRYLMKLSEYSLKSWIAICRLRQLQWSPQPINISVMNGKQISFLLEYQTDLKQLIQKLQEHSILFPNSHDNWIYFMILFATSGPPQQEDFPLLQNYFQSSQEEKGEGKEGGRSLESHQLFLNVMKEILIQEMQWNEIPQVGPPLATVATATDQIPSIPTTSPSLTSHMTAPPSRNKESCPLLKISYPSHGRGGSGGGDDDDDDVRRCDEDTVVATTITTTTTTDGDDLYIKGAQILLHYFYSYFIKNTKREVSDPHLLHAKNLARINQEHHQIQQRQRPASSSMSTTLTTSVRNLEIEKKQFLPLTTNAQKNRPRSSPVVSMSSSPLSSLSKRNGKGKKNTSSNASEGRLPMTQMVNDPQSSRKQKGEEQVDLSSLSYDDTGTLDLYRTALGSPPIPEDEPQPKLISQMISDSQLRGEYEAAGVVTDEPGGDDNSPLKNQVLSCLFSPPSPSPHLMLTVG